MSFFSWLQNRTSTRAPHGAGQQGPMAPRFRPRLEALEDRWMPSTLTVMNNRDSGHGSLRAEIAAAQSGDTIVFAANLKGQTITLTSGELSITKGLTIQGPGTGQLTVSGDSIVKGRRYLYRVFEVNASQPVVLSGLTMTGSNTFGGAIFNHTVLTVSGCTITGNAQYGGGIYNTAGATLTVSGCSLNGASASVYGGGIYNFGTLTVSQSTLARDTADIFGGGIYNRHTLTVSASTLSSNSAFGGGGGGIYDTFGVATLTNCTFSGNSAFQGQGGGLFVGQSATLTNCTFSGNSAFQGEGGGIYVNGPYGILNLINTIVAANGADIYGHVALADHNLVGDAAGSTGILNGVNGNIVGGKGNPVINADLGPLQNNGGPTQTMALLAGSPAIGQADNSKAPATDQRGVTRLDVPGETTDIGAFEL